MDAPSVHSRTVAQFLARCVSVDLEVDPKTAHIFALAAVFSDTRPAINSKASSLSKAFDRLEASLASTTFCLGHNILRHDIPHLAAKRPIFAELARAPIDTLWLNPLAFPRNPYHHLVKHYQDGRLQAGHVNDPERDARLVFELLEDQLNQFEEMNAASPDALIAYHYLTTRFERGAGFDEVFQLCRGAPIPSLPEAQAAVRRLLADQACEEHCTALLDTLSSPAKAWPTAYALAWISVAGANSVMPPWVRKQFPEASHLVKQLRGTNCRHAGCGWCQRMNDPRAALKRLFGFDGFRPEPVDADGRPLQERIVDEAMNGQSLLGILPTGTGKSVCYQIPALTEFEKTGALTVVISPLVALMSDQVQGMERAGIATAVTVNGMLSLPERQDALDKVRLGDASILLIAPEQLRSVSVRAVLDQREVGLWVFDEAHCVSKWGHDFRPDYRYVSRFIKEYSGDLPPAPVLCLTATAKPEVVEDIREHFRARLNASLLLLDGGAVRTNLTFEVHPTQRRTKLSDIMRVIEARLPADGASGAVIYCASRKQTEEIAEGLRAQGLAAEHFHAGLTPDDKKDIQERFRTGKLRIIAATNAFGMGIDKPDIRLVVHGDIPGSLENYLQEAGRAGRDREHAYCVLLFAHDDVERQFKLSAQSRLERHEIGAILKALRRLNEKTKAGSVVATSGEIVRAERNYEFERNDHTNDTRVKTAVAWLEEAALVAREENRVQVYPASLKVRTMDEAKARLAKAELTVTRRGQLESLVHTLMNAKPDEGISTDELAGVSGLTASELNGVMADLEALGIATNDVAITAYVHAGVEGQSTERFAKAASLENALIDLMREAEPDAHGAGAMALHLSPVCQTLRDQGHANARPDLVKKLLIGLAFDGRDQDGGHGNVHLQAHGLNTVYVTLQRSWDFLARNAELRRGGAERLLSHLLGKLPKGKRGKDVQVETTMGALLDALTNDALVFGEVKDPPKMLTRALLWLHEQQVLVLGKGLTVFRPAMTVHLNNATGGFTHQHFVPLADHYSEQTLQTHVMAAYAEKGLASIDQALRLSEDYFVMDQGAFLARWLPGEGAALRRATTAKSWKSIVGALGNPVQEDIVRDDREQTNVLVLAGPGSGKTRTLVHRIAYLVRVKREDPHGILVLSYNRHAASEIRARLRHLIGEDAMGVTVSTCHALAMRLVGASFQGKSTQDRDFNAILDEAVQLLQGEGLSKGEAEAQREALIQGYRWILVDEYQDIGPREYALIAAIAGRSLDDPELRLSLFAVGDDDQNIYAFGGASVEFIRRFEDDYKAKPNFLIENYRSTRHIINAANAVIAPASQRMKHDHDICINRSRAKMDAGGVWARNDPVGQGRVQLLSNPTASAAELACDAVDELVRLSHLDPDWDWAKTAIIARTWECLEAARSYAETLGLPVELANEQFPSVWRMRETQVFVDRLRRDPARLVSVGDLRETLAEQQSTQWTKLLGEGLSILEREIGKGQMAVPDFVEWLAEWSRDARAKQRGLLLLVTHRAKGLEFDDVVILDDDWNRQSRNEDRDAPRRLFYVAMTRARRSLAIMARGRHPFVDGASNAVLERRLDQRASVETVSMHRYVAPDMSKVDLSYAGRLTRNNRALGAIEAARVGDPIKLVACDDKWELRNEAGQTIGRMKRGFKPPAGSSFIQGQVGAIIRWRKTDNDEAFRSSIRRDEWETILPSLVFAEDDMSDG